MRLPSESMSQVFVNALKLISVRVFISLMFSHDVAVVYCLIHPVGQADLFGIITVEVFLRSP